MNDRRSRQDTIFIVVFWALVTTALVFVAFGITLPASVRRIGAILLLAWGVGALIWRIGQWHRSRRSGDGGEPDDRHHDDQR